MHFALKCRAYILFLHFSLGKPRKKKNYFLNDRAIKKGEGVVKGPPLRFLFLFKILLLFKNINYFTLDKKNPTAIKPEGGGRA